MTTNDWLQGATQQLHKANIATARLDAQILLGDCLNTNTAQLLAHPDQSLTDEQEKLLAGQLKRRTQHEPLAYIRGKCEFYGREFAVNKDVLVPRPETETMIDLAKRLNPSTVIDVGTGSGAIAITVACELHEVQVIATDIDPACLKVARDNCAKHQATVDLKKTNLVAGLELPKGALILANLPYVPDSHTINQAATNEPKRAIFGGPDGLDLYRQLFKQLKDHRGSVLTESLPFQHQDLAAIAQEYGYRLQTTDDFIQEFSSGAPRPE